MFSPGACERSVADVREHARTIGRDLGDDFEWLCLIYVRVDDDGERALLDGATAMAAEMGGAPSDYAGMAARSAAMGTPEQVAATLQRYVDAGVTHLLLKTCGPGEPTDQLIRVMTDVVPLLDSGR
jgi:alkanesulfonate monooxygenase SsuD/methylene tetrahydromethanopterin reductase-like flavin-dependent oxidoreductase (luciferase family)